MNREQVIRLAHVYMRWRSMKRTGRGAGCKGANKWRAGHYSRSVIPKQYWQGRERCCPNKARTFSPYRRRDRKIWPLQAAGVDSQVRNGAVRERLGGLLKARWARGSLGGFASQVAQAAQRIGREHSLRPAHGDPVRRSCKFPCNRAQCPIGAVKSMQYAARLPRCIRLDLD